MQWTRRKKLLAAHLLILCVLSVIFWQYFSGTVRFPETDRLLSTLALASGLFVWMFSGFILWKEKPMRIAGAFVFVAPLFFQVADWRAYLGEILIVGFLYAAAVMVEREQRERLKFSSARTLLVAKQISVFAFSFALSLGYFASIHSLSWDDLEPRFRLGHGAIEKILEWSGYIQPELDSLIEEKKTVNEYILSLDQTSFLSSDDKSQQFEQLNDEVGRLRAQGINVEFSGDALSSVRGAAKENTLVTGRKQLGELIGRPVRGDEEIGAVFAEILQTKLSALLEGSHVRDRISDRVLPLFVATLFFLTVWPIGLLLFSVWSVLSAAIITLFRSLHWIDLTDRTVTQEQLED